MVIKEVRCLELRCDIRDEVLQGGVPGVSLGNGGDSDREQDWSDHRQAEDEDEGEELVVGLTRREDEEVLLLVHHCQ